MFPASMSAVTRAGEGDPSGRRWQADYCASKETPIMALSGPTPDTPDCPAERGTKPNETWFAPAGSVTDPPVMAVAHAGSE